MLCIYIIYIYIYILYVRMTRRQNIQTSGFSFSPITMCTRQAFRFFIPRDTSFSGANPWKHRCCGDFCSRLHRRRVDPHRERGQERAEHRIEVARRLLWACGRGAFAVLVVRVGSPQHSEVCAYCIGEWVHESRDRCGYGGATVIVGEDSYERPTLQEKHHRLQYNLGRRNRRQ